MTVSSETSADLVDDAVEAVGFSFSGTAMVPEGAMVGKVVSAGSTVDVGAAGEGTAEAGSTFVARICTAVGSGSELLQAARNAITDNRKLSRI